MIEKYEEVHRQIRSCEEEISDIYSAKIKLRNETELKDEKFRKAIFTQQQIQEDWNNRNIAVDMEQYFAEDSRILTELVYNNEEEYYRRTKEIDRILYEKEELKKTLCRQLEEMREGEENGENNQTYGDCKSGL